jgi:hypothetical protein
VSLLKCRCAADLAQSGAEARSALIAVSLTPARVDVTLIIGAVATTVNGGGSPEKFGRLVWVNGLRLPKRVTLPKHCGKPRHDPSRRRCASLKKMKSK